MATQRVPRPAWAWPGELDGGEQWPERYVAAYLAAQASGGRGAGGAQGDARLRTRAPLRTRLAWHLRALTGADRALLATLCAAALIVLLCAAAVVR